MDFAHSSKQREYALWKADILRNLTTVRVVDETAKLKDGRPYERTRVITKVHPMYTKLWVRAYHLKRKTVDEFLVNSLTPIGLAIWYQDDGYLKNHSDFLTPVLETNGFNVSEHKIIEKGLADKFGLEFRSNKLNQNHLSLRLRRKDRDSFYEIVKPYIHASMSYKIENDGKVVQLFHDALTVICEICGEVMTRPYARRNRPNRFCSRCYNENRGSITGSAHFSEPRYSLTPVATLGAY
jgi:hypothetical protein